MEHTKDLCNSGKPQDQVHYKNNVIQPIILMQLTLTPEEFVGFLKGNIIKYTMRAGKKEGESVDKDKEKALAYKKLLERFTDKQPIDF